jgi:hypothetical protein
MHGVNKNVTYILTGFQKKFHSKEEGCVLISKVRDAYDITQRDILTQT